MKKFNKLFVAGKTKVQLAGEYGYRTVKSISETRESIGIDCLLGSFQRSDIISFTNKSSGVEMYPSVDDLYVTDQYGSVFERKEDGNFFVAKLNGRTLKQWYCDNFQ